MYFAIFLKEYQALVFPDQGHLNNLGRYYLDDLFKQEERQNQLKMFLLFVFPQLQTLWIISMICMCLSIINQSGDYHVNHRYLNILAGMFVDDNLFIARLI